MNTLSFRRNDLFEIQRWNVVFQPVYNLGACWLCLLVHRKGNYEAHAPDGWMHPQIALNKLIAFPVIHWFALNVRRILHSHWCNNLSLIRLNLRRLHRIWYKQSLRKDWYLSIHLFGNEWEDIKFLIIVIPFKDFSNFSLMKTHRISSLLMKTGFAHVIIMLVCFSLLLQKP